MAGFDSFYNTIVELMQKSGLEEVLVGIEPTGHYWFDLGQFMGEKNIKRNGSLDIQYWDEYNKERKVLDIV